MVIQEYKYIHTVSGNKKLNLYSTGYFSNCHIAQISLLLNTDVDLSIIRIHIIIFWIVKKYWLHYTIIVARRIDLSEIHTLFNFSHAYKSSSN